MTTPFTQALYGYRFVGTQTGDNLQAVASRELGDGTLWPQLVAINNLQPPYLTDDPGAVAPGVILTGSQIMVPAPRPTASATTDPNQVYLTDMTLAADGMVAVDGQGDFATVSGLANVKQALQSRIETEQGGLIMHTSYGSRIRRMIGQGNGPTAGVLAAQYAQAAVLADPRVSSSPSAVATITGDATSVVVQVVPVSGAPISINAAP